jgi:hypothetical protein
MTDFTRRTHVVRVWENPPPPGSSPETLGTGTSIDDEVMEIGRARHRKDRSLCPLRFGQGRAPVRSPALGARIAARRRLTRPAGSLGAGEGWLGRLPRKAAGVKDGRFVMSAYCVTFCNKS